MRFGIMFFPSADCGSPRAQYALVQEASRFADAHEFACVWTPERHFHGFGGLFPNPSVMSAALATITRRLQIRAGSIISPLHHTIRIAEEWALVDNLSNGRVALSFGSGWNVDDFIFFPDRYTTRQAHMYEQIETVRQLWAGKPLRVTNSQGQERDIQLSPRPVQRMLPIWVTSSGNVETFRQAGRIGANVLTHLFQQDLPTLAERIAAYRDARQRHGFDADTGVVSLMLHTFLGADLHEVRRDVAGPFRAYLKSAFALERRAALSGGAVSGGHRLPSVDISEDADELLELAVDRYLQGGSLIGTIESCSDLIWRLQDVGVSEIACLIDFGLPPASVLEGLPYLNRLRERFTPAAIDSEAPNPFAEALE
jgi:natural product biosynthesis luciferase-like monooxygenase protein